MNGNSPAHECLLSPSFEIMLRTVGLSGRWMCHWYRSQPSARIALQFWVPEAACFFFGLHRLSEALVSKYSKSPKLKKQTHTHTKLLPVAYCLVLRVNFLGQQATLASSGYLLEIQIFRPHPKTTKSDTLGLGYRPAVHVF